MKKQNITVFSTPTCPYCVMVKDYLKGKGVDFKDVDVSEDQKAAMEMFEESHQMGVPQIWIDNNIVIGFDPETIGKLIS